MPFLPKHPASNPELIGDNGGLVSPENWVIGNFLFPDILTNILSFLLTFLIVANRHLIAILICIFLITDEVEQFSINLLAI